METATIQRLRSSMRLATTPIGGGKSWINPFHRDVRIAIHPGNFGQLFRRTFTPPAATFEKDILPILEEHCYDCHGDGEHKGKVSFDTSGTTEALIGQTELWVNALKHLLFICSQNKLRSPTAEAVFAGMPGIDVDSAGLNHDAVVPLSPEQVEWADVIFVMEKAHREKLHRKFKRHLKRQRVIVLGIPDNYAYMDPALVALLKMKVTPLL